MNEAHPFFELGLFVLFRRDECPAEVVQHRQQLPAQRLGCAGRERFLLARGPLAVVVEVGRDPLQVVQVLVALGLQRREPLAQLLLGARPCAWHWTWHWTWHCAWHRDLALLA